MTYAQTNSDNTFNLLKADETIEVSFWIFGLLDFGAFGLVSV